jgi:hypothetical protein
LAVIVALGGWFAWHSFQIGNLLHLVIGALLFLYPGFAAIRAAIALFLGTMWVTLDAEGFAFSFPGRRERQRWTDVVDFDATTANWVPFVSYADGKPPRWWQLNRLMYFNGKTWIPDTYGLGAQSLARLMTAWRERALARREQAPEPYGSSSVSQ